MPKSSGRPSSVGRNVLWSYCAQGAAFSSSIVVAALGFRRLGPAGFGVYAIVVSIINLLGTANFGLGSAVVQATSRDDPAFSETDRTVARRDIEVAHAAYAALGVAALVGSAVIFVVVGHMGLEPSAGRDYLPLMVLLLGLSTAIYLGTSSFTGIPTGRRRFAVNAVSTAAGAAANILIVVALLGSLRAGALGLGQLGNVIVARTVSLAWLRREEPWFRVTPGVPRATELRRVAVFALPLLVISLGGQIIATTDLLVVGAVASASAVALYRIGSIAPNQGIVAVFTGVDTALPVLAATPDVRDQERIARLVSRVACLTAGAMYAAMMIFRTDVLVVLAGHRSELGEQVLLVFAGVWLVNVPVHTLALLLIARGRQGALAPLVTAEVVGNLALTVLLALWIGPIGAAIATLVTIFLSNQILLPWLLRREDMTFGPRAMATEGLLFLVAGMAFAGLGGAAFLELLHPGVLRLACGSAAAGAVGVAGGAALLGRHGRVELRALAKRRSGSSIDPSVLVPEAGA